MALSDKRLPCVYKMTRINLNYSNQICLWYVLQTPGSFDFREWDFLRDTGTETRVALS